MAYLHPDKLVAVQKAMARKRQKKLQSQPGMMMQNLAAKLTEVRRGTMPYR